MNIIAATCPTPEGADGDKRQVQGAASDPRLRQPPALQQARFDPFYFFGRDFASQAPGDLGKPSFAPYLT